MTNKRPPRDLIFGARKHDPAYWRAHPMVADSEAHFDDPMGWVGLTLKAAAPADVRRVRSEPASAEATRDDPDLYVWGEDDCPLDLFETAPDVDRLRVWIEGPVEGDDRTCWSVGLWLRRKD